MAISKASVICMAALLVCSLFIEAIDTEAYVGYGALGRDRANCRSLKAQERCSALPPAVNPYHRACVKISRCERDPSNTDQDIDDDKPDGA